MDELATVLATVFGAQVHKDERGIRTLVRSDDAYFTTRVRVDPVAELFIATRPLDGFELALRWNDRWGNPDDDAQFYEAFSMVTNDIEMSRHWLDTTTRRALLDSAYTYKIEDVSFAEAAGYVPGDAAWRPAATTRRTWTYELANDELVVTKGSAEVDANRIAVAIATGCTLAGRSVRWAREYAELANKIGASARSELELGRPIISATRSAVDVTLSLVRRLPDERTGRLRTLVTAKRVGHDDHTMSIVDDTAVRGMVPPVPKGSRRPLELEPYRLRASDDTTALDDLTKKLVMAARPSVVIADLDSINIWFDGAEMQHERIDAAVSLAARLAVGTTAAQGPYR